MDDALIEKIVALATENFRKHLREAFEAGGAKVRRDLLAALAQDDVALDVALHGLSDADRGQEKFGRRARHGTVRPTIMLLIERSKNGISASEIMKKTGFKVNSVRSTIATLRREGVVERSGDLWVKRHNASDVKTQKPRKASTRRIKPATD